MPNIPQQQTIVQYTANASQTQYSFAFYAPLPTDIQVFYQAPNATPIPSNDLLALNSQYTVTYNTDPTTGGIITLLFTPTTGYYLTINRQVAPSLNTSFGNAQNFNGENLDTALDRLLLLIQQNFNYITERNLSYVINTYLPNATPYTQLPPLAQNQVWIGSGSGVIAAPIAMVPSASVLQAMLLNNSPGTDGASIVGYYDNLTADATTVDAFLQTVSLFMSESHIETYPATDTGTANALSISITSPGFTLTAFQMFLVKVANTNTGASTLTINSTTINIKDGMGNALTNNMMVAGEMCIFVYDGVNLQLINPNKIYYGASLYVASARTLPPNGFGAVTFDTITYNPVGLASVAANNGFTINRAGYYRVNCTLLGAIAASSGDCFMTVNQNFSAVKRIADVTYNNSTSNSFVLSGSTIIKAAVNDVINVAISNNNSINTLTISSASPTTSNLDIEFLGS
jgi:hypothetical protein